MLSVLLTQSLCEGATTAEALSYGLTMTSSDYSDPLVDRDPRDYANQQVLFGDPSVRLYEPTSSPHIAAVDPLEESFDNHIPGRGTESVAALGASSYLPSTLTSLSVGFDYYETANYTEFIILLTLRQVVLIEPDTLSDLDSSLSSSSSAMNTFVRNGGVLVIFGVSESIPWLPWSISFEATGSGTSITFEDPTHPFLTSPNSLTTTVDYSGHFSEVWANLSILATDDAGLNPVIVAGVIGSGKVALTTTHPSGSNRNVTIENAVTWYNAPSIMLSELSINQKIIWAGDQVLMQMKLTDLVGNEIESANFYVWLNSSQYTAQDIGDGYYTVTLAGEWTRSNIGESDLLIIAFTAGYDTLNLRIENFILVRPIPILMIAALGGGLIVVVGGWIYWKRKRGDSIGWDRDSTPQDKQKAKERRKKESKSDVKEFFGV
jgi:hypothetical protein